MQKTIFYLFFFLLSFNNIFSQCAGTDNTITICNKDSDSNYQNFNLFNELKGVPETGGSWTANNPINKNSLNPTTGIVNLWAINKFGEHAFTYTNPKCNESSEITIFLGGYPGENNVDGGANTCSNGVIVDLFQFIDNETENLTADLNGVWTEDPSTKTNSIFGSTFYLSFIKPGTYIFYYTTGSVKNCSERTSKVILEVHRFPEAGEVINIEICDTNDLSPYTNVNLFDYVSGEDTNGVWVDDDGTNQISNPLDATINIEEIYKNFGSGIYTFSYTVLPTHGVCPPGIATVKISLPHISGKFKVDNNCVSNYLDIEIIHTRTLGSRFVYNLEYDIISTESNEIVLSGTENDISISNPDGTTKHVLFSLRTDFLPPGKYIIKSSVINRQSGISCDSFSIKEDNFNIYDSKVNFENLCYEGEDINTTISDFYDSDASLFNGNYDINYKIVDTINNEIIITANETVSFTNGTGSLFFSLNEFANDISDYNFSITTTNKNGLSCINSNFTLLPKLSGQFKVDDTCRNSLLNIEIEHTRTMPSDFTYNLEYEIINTNTNQVVYNGVSDTIKTSNLDGTIKNASLSIPQNTILPGSYIIKSSLIKNMNDAICDSFSIGEDNFSISDAKVNFDNLCYNNEGIDATIFDFHDSDGNIFNGTYDVNYEVTDVTNNTTLTFNEIVSFNEGTGILHLNLTNFSNNNNDYNLNLIPIDFNGLQCINTNFTINRVPEDIQLNLSVDNNCDASDLKVTINAPNLLGGEYTINYQVLEVSSANILIDNTIVFSGGSANYNVDITNLDEGFYNVILKSTQNDTTPCRTKFDFEVQENFSINGLPDAPTLEANQSFCLSNYHPNSPTLADIVVTSGENLTWYADNTSNNILNTSTTLINGEDYYVSSTSLNNNCESSERTAVTVTIFTPQVISSINTNPLFCGSENATLANLDAQANSGDLLWYDSLINGNLITPETLLVNGTTYYATESINGCESISRLPFTVTIISPPVPIVEGTTLLCELEKLTLSDFENSLTSTTTYNYIWYNALTGGIELDNSELLEENTIYYVANIHSDSGCESERIPISITLNNCNPEDYDFFIPDGFSPNNDGTNDYYFIPHIQYFYPSYQLEIFNRYGQSLFKGDTNNPKWDGTISSGNEVTSGVYFYILRYNKGDLKPKQGRIYLSK
ncbi:Gliding motility-associated C-terminal domain-containing protein [Tenacibaculum soleae]|uniref:gliding motility-associated C-terminal domain-containing protein n=1 Tax=Tenacibaculum soleae TaxID=447689 RepID=UPI003AB2C7CC